ncbi:MAG: phosphate/phosphite/phosphonate ABC transporter substrate-binding protein [Betaproteobacteria bacterium]|nr:phosphate/phosphite/phosphonate ABC transporter substrate-binding protein [Betaproteobacteria bacterium]
MMMKMLACLLLAVCIAPTHAQEYRPTGSAPVATTYVFGIHPYSTPQDIYVHYAPIMRYLEGKIAGVRFEVEASRDYADYEAKLAARRFHFSLPNPAQTVASFDHGYRVIAKMTPDDDFRGLFIARAADAPATPQELAAKPLCFTSPSALAGTLQPLMWLHDQGVDIKGLQIRHVGSQFSSILNAWGGEYVACGSTSRFFRTWSRANPDKAKALKVLWRTPPLPHNAVVARDDVAPEVANRVARTLAGLDKDPEVDQSQFRIDQQHFELAGNDAYKPVTEFLRRYDRAIGLPASIKPPKGR